jgi:hypothetical protein
MFLEHCGGGELLSHLATVHHYEERMAGQLFAQAGVLWLGPGRLEWQWMRMIANTLANKVMPALMLPVCHALSASVWIQRVRRCACRVPNGIHADYHARVQDSAEMQGYVCDLRIPRPCPACAIRMPHVTERCSGVATEADNLYINRSNHPPPIEIMSSGSDHESHAEGIPLSGWTLCRATRCVLVMISWGLELPTMSFPSPPMLRKCAPKSLSRLKSCISTVTPHFVPCVQPPSEY